VANKKSKFEERIISKMSKAEKNNSNPSDVTSSSPPVEMPQVQESIAVNKEIVKENRILNENLTLLSSAIQNLVKGMEKSIGESTKQGPSGIRGSTPSKSPYDRRNTVDAEKIADITQQDMEGKTPQNFGEVIGKWRSDKKEGLKETFAKAVTPSQWDIRPILGVESGSGSLADRLLANREARQAKDLEKNTFVNNAVKFGGVDEETAQEQFRKNYEAQKKTAEVNKRINEAKDAGYAPSKEDVEARNRAVREQIAVDPRKAMYATQDRRYKDSNNRIDISAPPENVQPTPAPIPPEVVQPTPAPIPPDTEQVSPTPTPVPLPPEVVRPTPVPYPNSDRAPTPTPILAGSELSETESESAAVNASIGETLKASLETQREILSIIKDGTTKSKSEDKEGKASGEESEEGSSLADKAETAGKVLKHGKKALPMLKSASSFLGRNAGKIGAAAGVAYGAYEAYTGWGDANEKLDKGEISEDQADELKGEAVGGGAGGAAGAWAGAAGGAAIGSVVPIVGTAIGGVVGGTLGYMAGSGLGKKLGGSLVSGYKSVKGWFGGGEEEPPAPVKPPERLDVSAVPSTSENTPPSIEGLGGGGVALANGNDSQLGEEKAPAKPPELQVWANKPPKLNLPKPDTSESLIDRLGGMGRSFNRTITDAIMAPTRSIGEIGLQAGESMSTQANKLRNWFTDDKRSALDKVGDVAYAPISAISSMTLGAGGKIKEGFDSLFGDDKKPEELRTWANKPPTNLKWPAPDKAVSVNQIKPTTIVEPSGMYIDRTTSDIVSAKEAKLAKETSTSVVNAPTTINNNTTNVGPPLPIRNPENTQSRYIGSRFAF
jgi:hypothetical protein